MTLAEMNDEFGAARTNKKDFLNKMDSIIPWGTFVKEIEPYYYKGERGNKPYPLELMLRIYMLQNLYDLADMKVMYEILDSRAFTEFCCINSPDEVPDGETGEVCILGGGVSNGYIGEHDEENKAFVRLADGTVMYRSGDLGYYLPDGNIAFLHRKDTQIMIYGKRVEVMEVESKLYQCSGVEQAIVRPFTDEEGLSYMIAYIVPKDNNVKVSQIRHELAENLTPFMIPEFIVKMPQIPLNTNGKPDMSRMPVVMKEGQAYERIG